MSLVRITAVSYYNTLPLIYGITRSGLVQDFMLTLDVPSGCANQLLSGETDISLVPVGALPLFPDYRIIGNHCIGAVGKVRTVLLLAHSPVENLRTIYLDKDSMTSVNLVKILCRKLWKIDPEWKHPDNMASIIPGKDEGIVMIGDKTFGACELYNYCYDLSESWFTLTSLPFVFAVWITVRKIDAEFQRRFEAALEWGVEHLVDSISLAKNLIISQEELIRYLEKDISFHLDEPKIRGMELYLKWLNEMC